MVEKVVHPGPLGAEQGGKMEIGLEGHVEAGQQSLSASESTAGTKRGLGT
jgi:hypothetical protein